MSLLLSVKSPSADSGSLDLSISLSLSDFSFTPHSHLWPLVQGAEFRKIMIQRCYVEVIFNQSSLFSGFSSSPPSEPRETGAKRIFLKNIFWLSVNHEVKGHGQIPQLTLNYLLSK